MTFIASAAVTDGADLAIASPTTFYHLETGLANFSSGTSLRPPLPLCQADECVRVFVPQPDLAEYTVTSVERIIDQLVITRTQDEYYFLEAAQRIRILGERIPEPGTIILVVSSLAYWAFVRSARRSRHASPHQLQMGNAKNMARHFYFASQLPQ
jgi:hypothetical protein